MSSLIPKMPVMFFGHGSPMNAIEINDYTKSLRFVGTQIPVPKAIVVISAHWMTEGVWVTSMKNPKTIHDFYGFPKELNEIIYPAQGSEALSGQIISNILDPKITPDFDSWGLDHGTWAVLKHIYPNANVPVIQLSLDMRRSNAFHFELGQKLNFLRSQGVLIIGSGNIVHNLARVDFNSDAKPFDWAIEFDQVVKQYLIERNFKVLVENARDSAAGKLSIPTVEHYLPLLYILGASDNSDKLTFLYEGIQNASMSMRCLSFS